MFGVGKEGQTPSLPAGTGGRRLAQLGRSALLVLWPLRCQALSHETRAGQNPVTVWRLIRNVSEVTQPLESGLERPREKIYCASFFQLGWSCCKNVFFLSFPFDI